MQQCAQCSKSAASTSAHRLAAAFDLPSWLQQLQDSTAKARSSRARVRPSRSKHARLIRDSTSSPAGLLYPLAGTPTREEPDASTSAATSTSRKHANAGHIAPRRGLSTSARVAREENTTQARFIDRAPEGSSPDGTSSTKSTSAAGDTFKEDGKDNKPATSSKANPSLQYLTEEVVQSSNLNDKAPSKDEINTLLAYPTLFDPIRKPRHPIVLCHGLYGFDTWGLELLPALKVHYWADVLHVLRGIVGVDPVVVGVPGTGAITERAKQLHNVLRNDKKLRGKEVNLIGHSMGGLDCRHLLSNIRPTEYHPVSLTTLATPHRGSPFMAWCRANIGIGDIAKAAEEASKEASSSSSAKSEVNLPYSLKTPIFSRSKWQREHDERSGKSEKDLEALEQTKEAARQAVKDASSKTTAAITKTVINLPGLNYSLGTSLASYLLDLLDSPAYSNLTSDFLENQFNPNTPDRKDIRYFSVAASCKKLPITHPLWLPKLIVDKAQELERLKDKQLGRERPADWQWGNDGLVPVESAKWGEFLGVLEGVDHWSIRGGAGFTTEPKGKKKTAPATTTPATEKKSIVGNDETKSSRTSVDVEEESSELERLGEKAKSAISSVIDIAAPVAETASNVLPDFNWSDINSAVFKGIDDRDGAGKSANTTQDNGKKATSATSNTNATSNAEEKANIKRDLQNISEAKTATSSANGNNDALKTLGNIAGWIVKRIPLPTSSNKQLKSSIDPAYPLDDATSPPKTGISNASNENGKAASTANSPKSSVTNAARLLFGNSPSKTSNKSSNGDSNKFDRDRFYVALCKKLYDEGM